MTSQRKGRWTLKGQITVDYQQLSRWPWRTPSVWRDKPRTNWDLLSSSDCWYLPWALTYSLWENGDLASIWCVRLSRLVDAREAFEKRVWGRNEENKKTSGSLPKIHRQPSLKMLRRMSLSGRRGFCRRFSQTRPWSQIQLIFPLRGKVLNTEKAKMADSKRSKITTMITIIGAELIDFNLDDIKYTHYHHDRCRYWWSSQPSVSCFLLSSIVICVH